MVIYPVGDAIQFFKKMWPEGYTSLKLIKQSQNFYNVSLYDLLRERYPKKTSAPLNTLAIN